HQLIQKYVSKPGVVLDVGAGTGKLLEELKLNGWQVSGVDGAIEAVEQSKRRGVVIHQHDIRKKLPFKVDSFDLVTSLDVLEHIKDDKSLLIEMRRVLKPQGIILITVPAYQWLFSYWDKMLKHFRRYEKMDLVRLGNKAGLKLIFISFYSSFFLLPAVLVRLLKTKNKDQRISDFQSTPLALISVPVLNILAIIERLLIKYVRLPFGMSLVCVFQKN
ncbi:MAG: class I SAM-dependent methyltransferase, partial [Candidatus Beckwithbacteria bacterium]